MKHDIISVLALGSIMYITGIFEGIAINVKHYIRVEGLFRWILGYGFFKQDKFSLKGVVYQTGNIVAIIIGMVAIILGCNDVAQLFLDLMFANLVITGIVSIFTNKWK